MLDGGEYSDPMNEVTAAKKMKNKNKRRFSDDQIRSLELIFESESRLEPLKKLQLSRELGLQPRQVAIWFQNKRARWKSKQLEQEYNVLRANYSSLASKFEALKKEKQALVVQLQKLRELMKKPGEQGQEVGTNSTDRESQNGETTRELQVPASLTMRRSEQEVGVPSDDDSPMKAELFGLEVEEEPDLMSMVEPADGSLTSSEDWRSSLDSEGLFDQSSSSYRWWDFWS